MTEKQKRLIKDIKVLFLSLCMGVSFFLLVSLAIAYLEIINPAANPESLIRTGIIANLVAFLVISFGLSFFKRQMQSIRRADPIKKLEKYKTITLIRAASIETAAFVFMILFIYTGAWYLLIEAAAVFAYLLFLFPNEKRISGDLEEDFTN